MNLLEQKQQEIESLKSKIKIQEERIASLEKQNQWYIEQFKLRQHQKFGASSEKADKDQISIVDVFSDVFNEAETLKKPITIEPNADIVIPTHNRKKAKRGSKFENLPVETITYELSEEEKVCETCGKPLTEMKKEVRGTKLLEALHKALKEELFTDNLLYAGETVVELLKEPGR